MLPEIKTVTCFTSRRSAQPSCAVERSFWWKLTATVQRDSSKLWAHRLISKDYPGIGCNARRREPEPDAPVRAHQDLGRSLLKSEAKGIDYNVSTRRRISDRPKQAGGTSRMRAQARHRMSQARGVAQLVKTALGMRSGARTGVALSLLLSASPPFRPRRKSRWILPLSTVRPQLRIQFTIPLNKWSGCEFLMVGVQ